MNETVLTVVGHVASEPALRVTSSGMKVASFRLASTERRYDKGLSAWRDGDTIFWSVSCWRAAAENVAESLAKGQPVIVHGRLKERGYEKDGQHRTSLEIDAMTIGHDLTRGVARFTKAAGIQREEPVGPLVPVPQLGGSSPDDDELTEGSGSAA